MIRYYDFATGQIVDDGPAPADTRVPETATGIAQLRLLTVAEASANERCQRRFDDVIGASLVAALDV
ncbi:MAG: hypothetical protein KDI88_14330 [Gammaproteobacteria bacterium]|nr:hypothetical protein [Gammaproteobacteria bacterium]